MPLYYTNIRDWYWIVAGSATDAWSSASQTYVPVASDTDYLAWVAVGNTATPVPTEGELWQYLIENDAADLLVNVPAAQSTLEAHHSQYSFVKDGDAHTFRAVQQETGVLIKGLAATGFSGNLLQLGDGGDDDKFNVDQNGKITAGDALLEDVRTDTVGAGGQNTNVPLYGVKGAIGTGAELGLLTENTTDAAAGAQQYGPVLASAGRGWKTNATAESQPVYAGWQTVPVQGAANPSAYMRAVAKINTGAWASLNIVIMSDGKVGFGTTSPASAFEVATAEATYPRGITSTQYALAGVQSVRRANGTLASPTAITSGQVIGRYAFGGHDGTAFSNAVDADMVAIAAENWAVGAHGTHLTFETTPIGLAAGASERMRIHSNGACYSVGVDTLTLGASVSLDITKPNLHELTINAATDPTINFGAAGTASQELTVLIHNSSGGSRLVTFGTNTKVTSTPNPTDGQSIVIKFISNGSTFREVSRATTAT